MIYLEKTEQTALDLVSNFLEQNWLEQEDGTFKYQNIGYGDIKNPVSKFRKIFVDEQGGKCCYCCREIINGPSTELEHIIPRSLTKISEFADYFKLSKILKDNIVPQDVFVNSTLKLLNPPYPHHIAYQNIVASCHGKTFQNSEDFTCCNRHRGDVFLPPFNLMKGSVGYLPDGTIVYLPEILNRSFFITLNLDKSVLNDIRRLWNLFSKSQLDLAQILDDNFTATISEKISVYALANSPTIVDDMKLNETFSIPEKWEVFKDYAFFFDYYRLNP